MQETLKYPSYLDVTYCLESYCTIIAFETEEGAIADFIGTIPSFDRFNKEAVLKWLRQEGVVTDKILKNRRLEISEEKA